MDIKKTIIEEFDLFVKNTFKNNDIINFLINHERKHIFVEKLKKQIDGARYAIMPIGETLEEKRKLIKSIARDFANMFCKVALKVKEAEISNGKKTRLGHVLKSEGDLHDEKSIQEEIDSI